MTTKCDPDTCSLAGAVDEIRKNQQEQHDATLRMEVGLTGFFKGFDEFKELNEKQHDVFYERTRWGVTWKGLAYTIGGIIAALGTIYSVFGG